LVRISSEKALNSLILDCYDFNFSTFWGWYHGSTSCYINNSWPYRKCALWNNYRLIGEHLHNKTMQNIPLARSPRRGVSTILGTTGNNPWGITIDSLGNIYTSNAGANNVSKITPAGVSTIFGTTGSYPQAITIDSMGNIYTANVRSNNVSKITPAGVSTIFGTTGNAPNAITIDSLGNIYTANFDSYDSARLPSAEFQQSLVLQVFNPLQSLSTHRGISTQQTLVQRMSARLPRAGDSTILGPTGNAPYGITIDSSGNIYTANYSSNNVSKITPAGDSTILGTTGGCPYGINSRLIREYLHGKRLYKTMSARLRF
jgi:hypothetical protein